MTAHEYRITIEILSTEPDGFTFVATHDDTPTIPEAVIAQLAGATLARHLKSNRPRVEFGRLHYIHGLPSPLAKNRTRHTYLAQR